MIPDPTLDVSQYLFHHPGVDFIWTTGGPKAVAAANEAGKPCLSVGAGNAPVYVHRSADMRMAVVDILISKTFDASVICPAEQTCVDRRRDLRRRSSPSSSAWARGVLDRRARSTRSPRVAFERRRRASSMDALGPVVRRTSAAMAGFEVARRTTRCCSRRCPPTSTSWPRHPLVQEKLMPVLGLVRSPSVEHGDRGLRARHRARRPRPHLGRLRAATRTVIDALRRGDPHRAHPRQRADRGRRAGRRLQLDDADLLARLRHLGRLARPPTTSTTATCSTSRPSRAARRRRSGSGCPSDTYFNAGALENLRAAARRARC